MALSGCGGSPKGPKGKPKPDPKAKPTLEQTVQTSAAEGTRYSTGSSRRPLWTVKWTRADLTYSEEGAFYGTAYGVSGTFFKGTQAASTFQAKRAVIAQNSNTLELLDGVTVESKKPASRLECNAVLWDPEREVGEARGNVRFTAEDVVLGPFEAFRFSPELNAAGTPGVFGKRYGK